MDNIEKEKIEIVHKPELVVASEGTRSVGASPGKATVVPLDVHDDELVGTTLESGIFIQALIGKGGMSSVYRGEQLMIGRTVAVKILHSLLFSEANAVMRFQQEAKAVGSLDHPGIIKVHEFHAGEKGRSYLVMEHIEGVTLSSLVSKSESLDWKRLRNIFAQACDALDHAHKRGIVHRDIKPSNIMLVKSEQTPDFVKILDFGIAKMLIPENEALRLTQTGEVFGSPLYMSPEQCTAQRIDHRSDIYSLGCVLYEALTGKPPLSGSNIYETIFKHTSEMPKSLRAYRPQLEHLAEFEAVVLKAMAKNPADRFQSMGEFKLALEAIGQTEVKSAAQKVREKVELLKRKKSAQKTQGPPPYTIPAMIGVFALVLAISWSVAMQHGASSQASWQSLYESGQQAFDKGDYKASADLLAQAKEKAVNDPTNLSATVKELIDLQRAQGQTADQALVALSAKLETSLRTQLDHKLQLLSREVDNVATQDQDKDPNQIKRICNEINDCVASLIVSSGVFDESAEAALTKALAASDSILGTDSKPSARSAHNLGLIALSNQDYAKAHERFDRALKVLRKDPNLDPVSLLKGLEWQARTARLMGNTKEAISLLEERLERSMRIDPLNPIDPSPNNVNVAHSKFLLAEAAYSNKDATRSADLLTDATAILSEQKATEELAICTALLGHIKYQLGNSVEAEPLLSTALASMEKQPNKRFGSYLPTVLMDLGDIANAKKDVSKSEALWRRALVIAMRQVPRDQFQVMSLEDRLKDSPILLDLLKTRLGLDKATLGNNSQVVFLDYCDLARVSRRQGDLESSEKAWKEALSLFQSAAGKFENLSGVAANGELDKASGSRLAVEIHLSLAEISLDRRKPEEASKQYSEAVALLESKGDWKALERNESAKRAATSIEMRKAALPNAQELLSKLEPLKR